MGRFLVRLAGAAMPLFLAACQAPQMAVGALASGHLAEPSGIVMASTGMPTGPVSETPSGYAAFCRRDPANCLSVEGFADQLNFEPGVLAALQTINAKVNATIRPMEDTIHYGRFDYWTIPKDGYGDCEDYAVAKRKALADAGFSRRALRIAIAQLPSGEAHAVLTVVTDRGDYVLDNRNNEIMPWQNADLTWIARQVPGQDAWAAIGLGMPPLRIATR